VESSRRMNPHLHCAGFGVVRVRVACRLSDRQVAALGVSAAPSHEYDVLLVAGAR
jgi:hypothetical protein